MPITHRGEPLYLFSQTPRVTTAAATDFFDIFNASGSGVTMRLLGIWPILQITATQALFSFQFSVIRTSAVGTGGTAAAVDAAAAPAAGAGNVTRVSLVDSALPAQVTMRTLPTGGATANDFLFDVWIFPEDATAMSNTMQALNMVPVLPGAVPFDFATGEGFKIRQITATASTGAAFGWLVAFTLV